MSYYGGVTMSTVEQMDQKRVGDTLDSLIDMVSDFLPVDSAHYPNLSRYASGETVEFCIRHSALHFTKTAGKLASWIEDADHGNYRQIDTLEAVVVAGLVNSLKLADEIGVSGADIISQLRERYLPRD